MRLDLDRAAGTSSIRISFTDQQLSAHGGMVVWSHFLHQKKFRAELAAVLPHAPTSPNAYAPTEEEEGNREAGGWASRHCAGRDCSLGIDIQ